MVRPDKDPKLGLHYGVNFMHGVTLNRDRDGLRDRRQASRVIYQIWAPLLLASDDARKKYINLLFHHEHCMEVNELSSCISKEVAVSLFKGLQDEYGLGAFFFYATDTTEPTRIIEGSLKMTPVRLTQGLWDSLRKHSVVATPSEAREAKFIKLPDRERQQLRSTESQTIHTFRAFLRLDPAMSQYLGKWTFKSCHFDLQGVESSVTEDRILLSDQLLKTE